MNTIKTFAFAAVAALSLGVGAAMAQEGPRATESGAAYFGTQAPVTPVPYGQAGTVQSGSSDVEVQQPYNNGHYFWTPGNDSHNAGSEG